MIYVNRIISGTVVVGFQWEMFFSKKSEFFVVPVLVILNLLSPKN